MNCKLEQVTVRVSRASNLLFQGSSYSSSRRATMLRYVHANEEEEEQRVEEAEEQQHAEEEEQQQRSEEEATL
jgi:hypothetical protein